VLHAGVEQVAGEAAVLGLAQAFACTRSYFAGRSLENRLFQSLLEFFFGNIHYGGLVIPLYRLNAATGFPSIPRLSKYSAVLIGNYMDTVLVAAQSYKLCTRVLGWRCSGEGR